MALKDTCRIWDFLFFIGGGGLTVNHEKFLHKLQVVELHCATSSTLKFYDKENLIHSSFS